MKKLISLFAVVLTAAATNAQLRVDSLGNVKSDKSLYSYGPLSVTTSSVDAVTIFPNSTTASQKRGAYIYSYHYPGLNKRSYNIYSNIADWGADSTTPGRVYGVYSIIYPQNPYVTETSSAVRYGLCGITSACGAGVYGGTSGVDVILSQPYAGYFNGNTHVQGNLTVSGNVSGLLLTSVQSSDVGRGTSVFSDIPSNLPRQLKGLTARAYYYEHSSSALSLKNSEAIKNDTVHISSEDEVQQRMVDNEAIPEEKLPLNHIRKQIYSKQHYSLSAEELEEVFPDLVYENEDGTKSINYVEMVPILVQAIGELQGQIDELKGGKGDVMMKKKETGIDEIAKNVQVLSLGQNKPNPFSGSTDIAVSVPERVQNAFIYVYDLQGKKVQQVDITARGRQTVKLAAADLAEGMYLYSLIADGKVVETRRMIIEK